MNLLLIGSVHEIHSIWPGIFHLEPVFRFWLVFGNALFLKIYIPATRYGGAPKANRIKGNTTYAA